MLWGIDFRIMFELGVLSQCRTQKVKTNLFRPHLIPEGASLTTIHIYASYLHIYK